MVFIDIYSIIKNLTKIRNNEIKSITILLTLTIYNSKKSFVNSKKSLV